MNSTLSVQRGRTHHTSGTDAPAGVDTSGSHFEALFSKAEAIGLVASIPEGGTARVTIDGRLQDGTPVSLVHPISVRD